jgi:hypothetical protein
MTARATTDRAFTQDFGKTVPWLGRTEPMTVLHGKKKTILHVLGAMTDHRHTELPKPGRELIVQHLRGGLTRIYKTKIKDSDRGNLLWALETWAVDKED